MRVKDRQKIKKDVMPEGIALAVGDCSDTLQNINSAPDEERHTAGCATPRVKFPIVSSGS